MSDNPRATAGTFASATSDLSVPRTVTEEVEGPLETAVPANDETISRDTASVPQAVPGGVAGPPQIPEPARDATLDRRARAQIQTVRLDSRDFRPSWPTAIASLEQLSGWAVLALRLGTLALIQQCVRELAQENARADAIVRLRALTDALAHMPLET